ncbi:MAG: hypothetical protein IJ157_02225 [Clostridia bacterium]|nr:hypothetical protein [Clostridia bacterium]
MRGKIVLLYESERGKALCDAASYIITQVALAFGHTLSMPMRRCDRSPALTDDIADLCGGALGVLAGESGMQCLPALADEMGCLCRERELRYTHLIENRSLMGASGPLNAVLIQALGSDEDSLRAAAVQAYALSARDSLPITQVPPSGKLAEGWKKAMERADSMKAPFHARETALQQMVPDMVYRPTRLGVILCPPYAGGILAEAAAALCGAPGMCYDAYLDGDCGLYAALRQESDDANPFGMLRAVYRLLRDTLKLEREAACVEAALRNVLQAGWRTTDTAREDVKPLTADQIVDLVCQQIEVAGEWINSKQ